MHEMAPLIVFATISWIAWLIFSSLRRYMLAKLQTGLQVKVLEKMDSAQSALAYVESEAGKDLFRSLSFERQEVGAPYRSILSGVRWGIMLIAFGAVFFALRSIAGDHANAHTVIGSLAMALGVGCEIAAAATYFLSHSFGLLKNDAGRQ